MSNNVLDTSPGDRKGVGCYKRVMERLSVDSMDRSAKVGSKRCLKFIETGQARFWNDFEKHVEVETVQRPDLPDECRFHWKTTGSSARRLLNVIGLTEREA